MARRNRHPHHVGERAAVVIRDAAHEFHHRWSQHPFGSQHQFEFSKLHGGIPRHIHIHNESIDALPGEDHPHPHPRKRSLGDTIGDLVVEQTVYMRQ